jgi:hypothetical protein
MMRQADHKETEMRRKEKEETTSTVPTLMEKLRKRNHVGVGVDSNDCLLVF